MDYCLRNVPETIFGGAKCGNGVVEHGEECDCGFTTKCPNKCCIASECKLAKDAICANGDCCDLETCKVTRIEIYRIKSFFSRSLWLLCVEMPPRYVISLNIVMVKTLIVQRTFLFRMDIKFPKTQMYIKTNKQNVEQYFRTTVMKEFLAIEINNVKKSGVPKVRTQFQNAMHLTCCYPFCHFLLILFWNVGMAQ